MPYAIRKTENGFGVQNTETGEWRSKDTSEEKAKSQMRLLEGIKHHTIDQKSGKSYSQAKR